MAQTRFTSSFQDASSSSASAASGRARCRWSCATSASRKSASPSSPSDDRGKQEAEEYGIKFVKVALTRDNYRRELDPYIGRGDFVLNVSVDVSSIALVKFCWSKGAMYLDTCIEPWPGGYTDATIPHAKRTNYALREEALALRAQNRARAHRGAHARRQSRAWCRTS